ncbi:MAG: type II toxin-antitoxin system HicA family toxin [Runella sp.]
MIPKEITAQELIKKIKKWGYEPVRQKGSHIRIQTLQNGKHSETIPNHKPLKEGTLKTILSNIAKHFELTSQEFIEKLFDYKP